jgi:hypothetical protein
MVALLGLVSNVLLLPEIGAVILWQSTWILRIGR